MGIGLIGAIGIYIKLKDLIYSFILSLYSELSLVDSNLGYVIFNYYYNDNIGGGDIFKAIVEFLYY